MVGKTGFEPATPWSQTKCSTKLSHFPNKYINMVRSKGFEPLTFWFVAKHSIQLSYERMTWVVNIKKMLAPAGIEPATQGFSVPCSTNWAMKPKIWRSQRDSNPRSSAWQADVLTSCTMRPIFLVAGRGFEPLTSGLWAQRATKLLHPAI